MPQKKIKKTAAQSSGPTTYSSGSRASARPSLVSRGGPKEKVLTPKESGVGTKSDVKVQSTTTSSTSQKSKNGRAKTKSQFTHDQKVTDLNTGETVASQTQQKSKKGKIRKDKTVTKITNSDDKLLVKQVDRNKNSRLRVTKTGRQSGY